jgi:hypothetical protein
MAKIMVEARKADKDIGDIVALSLYRAADQLGDVEKLVAGRPGSWEADFIRRFVGTGKHFASPALDQELITRLHEPYAGQLVPLFVEMGKARVDGGDELSLAMGKAVNDLGGVKQFVGDSLWRDELSGLGRQHSDHWNDDV